MNVLISPNAFKGTMTAREAGEVIREYIESEYPNISTTLLPIADGGDGTCELLTEILQLEKKTIWSLDAFGRPIPCSYGWDDSLKKAYIDVSMASGVASLQSEELDPYVSSSYGTGLLVRDAINLGAEEIILGLGGSATIDLGIGILSELGIGFLDKNGRELTKYSPQFLSKINHIQKSTRIPKVKFTCLCDVKNTFFGQRGAVPVFGPQKGLLPEQIESYELICESVVSRLFTKQRKVFEDKPGFGAAGGIALGLSVFFETEVKFGSDYFFEKVDLESKVNWADRIITGEGRYDDQSAEGKACYELMKLARHRNKKIALITSGTDPGAKKFDLVLTLPDLDFSQIDYRKKSRENLRHILDKGFTVNF
ncbi:glycerate kinase [Algoriphagus winogradskyi]|uniref:Glycerate kinase n=1 Tax=Algoriphagus winogradskyi TaxID=237017 RepID=A0ABY1N6N2_9BACT|nr:glycerate kinase [Algoriphagus winogradskyi]SMP01879.1 glycerate kinase [Algoriphagus winogradskyi]